MKLAVVTGTSRGLGRALAERLLGNGYEVLGLSRTHAPGLREHSTYRHVDFDLAAMDQSLPRFLAVLEAGAVPSELLFVHNASVVHPVGLITRLGEVDLRKGMEINLIAPILLSQVILKYCEAKKISVRMIFISSSAAERAIPGLNLYAIAKAGLEMLVRSIHSEVRENGGVTCIGFRPGRMNTEMQAEMRSYSQTEFPAVVRYQESYAKGLLADPENVADAVLEKLVFGAVESGRTYSYEDLKVVASL